MAIVCIVSTPFSESSVNLTGKVITRQGTAAFDVVVTLLGANISDTADSGGNYRLFRQGTALRSRPPITAGQRTDRGIVGKGVCIGGRLHLGGGTSNITPLVIDLRGRTIGSAGVQVPDGIYFLYYGLEKSAVSGGSHTALAVSAADTLSLSYQGTFIKNIPVVSFDGTLDITLDSDLPARKHSVLVASYSKNKAYIVSASNQVEWEYGMPGSVQDAWMLPNGNILLCGGSDVREVTRAKEIVWKYTAGAGEIHNCHPLPGGVVLFGENSSGKLFEINRTTNTVVLTIQTQCKGDNHTRFRMVRKTRDNTYLVAARGENNVYELDNGGAVLRKIGCDALKTRYGINWDAVHSALKLENGNILIGGGYNSVFIELDKNDSIVWKLSAADIPEVGFNFAAAGQILPGGTFLFGAFTSTFKLVEVTRAKKVIWKLQNSTIGDPTHAYVIDCWGSGNSPVCEPATTETLLR